jgi:hypothetical protein
MLRLLMFLTVLLYATVPIATAELYWVAYEGNDYPENEGWTRVVGGGGSGRSLEDGALVLDSRKGMSNFDLYQMSRAIDPGPSEFFRMEWRARYDMVAPRTDPGMSVFSDESWAVAFEFSDVDMRSVFEPGVTASFAPGVFHEFTLVSSDMRLYEVYIDGVSALVGAFDHVFSASRVGWGDVIQGAESVSRWDYFRFGVVPEPSAACIAVCGTVMLLSLRPRNKRSKS